MIPVDSAAWKISAGKVFQPQTACGLLLHAVPVPWSWGFSTWLRGSQQGGLFPREWRTEVSLSLEGADSKASSRDLGKSQSSPAPAQDGCVSACVGVNTHICFTCFLLSRQLCFPFLVLYFFFFHALTHCPNTYSIHRPQVELNPAQVRAMSSRPHLLRCSVSAANGVRQCWDSTSGTSIEDASVPNHALTKGHVPFLFFS